MNFVRAIVKFFYDFLEPIVLILSVLMAIYLFVLQPFEVSGGSMIPNFHDGEYVLADKISYKFTTPKRGDVVIIVAPYNHDEDYIKRVVGLPGESVTVVEGKVYVNFEELKEDYASAVTTIWDVEAVLQEAKDYTIPSGKYLVMGDNRPHSFDGRNFGAVPLDMIVGKAVFRIWPPRDFGIIPKITY